MIWASPEKNPISSNIQSFENLKIIHSHFEYSLQFLDALRINNFHRDKWWSFLRDRI